MDAENSSLHGEESEDDFDWEEVEVAAGPALTLDSAQLQAETAAGLAAYYGESQEAEPGPSEKQNIEITIQTKRKQKGDPKSQCVCRPLLPVSVIAERRADEFIMNLR